ncbi:MAG: hypothetical protein OXI80_01390 [Caldilineaceae bacterium]|nr:hypothetical protein [Caldilineaceae bacterium]MDE0336297.1 hypothetical protein [Caldilineaceae bacterium]
METEEIKWMNVSELAFDLNNPRLVEFEEVGSATDEEVIKILWELMDVREVMMSIAASGFFPHEPLIVAVEDGKKVVIEGNRRLAAVNILLNRAIAEPYATNVPNISAEAKRGLARLPIVVGSREEFWRYLGFKHVNGPAKWSSYAKSQYIADVHRKYGVRLEEIANQIGDTHKTVQRLFRGLMVIEQAERMGVFDREDRWRKHFSFSHIYTGLDYQGISEFIGLRPETEEQQNPVPEDKKKELGELCLWMYGSKREQELPVVQTQNPHLRRLSEVVANRKALDALREGIGLDLAFEATQPSSEVFEKSLLAARRHLEKARGLLSTGDDGSEELLRTAGTVANLADDLYDEMERKRKPAGKKRIAEGV